VAELIAITRLRGQSAVTPGECRALFAPLDRGNGTESGAGAGESAAICAASGAWGIALRVPAGASLEGRIYEDGDLAVVCDSEFYNHAALAKAVGTDGTSEAATLAALYRRHEDRWFVPVSGVFRAFIADKRTGRLLAYEDRVGVKTLAYSETSRGAYIASRISLLSSRPGFARKIDPQAVHSYLFMEMIPTPFSVFQGIKKLESGHRLSIDDGAAPKVERFWNMPFPAEKLSDEEEIKRRAYALTKEAVAEQFGYGPAGSVGAFLSGGTDSSTVCGLINELHPGQARTFSIGFDETGFDETHYARIAAKAFATQHTEYVVTAKDVEDLFPTLIRAYDEPFANSSAIPTYFCSQVAREHGVKVMLAGDGGDEIFGGNSRYVEVLDWKGKIPTWMAKTMVGPAAQALGAVFPHPLVKRAEGYARRSYSPFARRIHDFSLLDFFGDEDVFRPEFLSGPILGPVAISQAYLDQAGTSDPLDQYMYHDLKLTSMDNDLRKVNRMTQVAGMGVRYPYLNTALMEFTGRIPPGLKVKNGRLRHLFKETFKGLLPQEIIEKKKHGFGLPVVRWMLRPGRLGDLYRESVFGDRLKQRGIFKPAFLETLEKRSKEPGTEYLGKYLYYIFFLESWLRVHVDGDGA